MADHWWIKQSESNMNVNTGKTISEIAHIKQSITNILTTPIGSRIMRRDYGSRLFERIDQPINGDLIAEIYSDVVEALRPKVASISGHPAANFTYMQDHRCRVTVRHWRCDCSRKFVSRGRGAGGRLVSNERRSRRWAERLSAGACASPMFRHWTAG